MSLPCLPIMRLQFQRISCLSWTYISVADKAVMICDALWVNGRVTLDVGPDTLTAQPYRLAGCLGIDD